MYSDFLFELGTEELPPKALKNLSAALEALVLQDLKDLGLKLSSYQSFASPRRLGLLLEQLEQNTPFSEEKVWGPPARIARDESGQLTKAGQAFCQRNQLSPEELQYGLDGKTEKVFCIKNSGGEATKTILPAIIEKALSKLPIPKRMRWGSKRTEFVRPVHWLVLLQDLDVIPCEILGLKSDRFTRGHRFLASKKIAITHAKDYNQTLREEGNVLASFEERAQLVKEQVEACAKKMEGRAIIDSDLLNEVCALVEWPIALAGKFESTFLKVPSEALISSMKEHQKYFHVVNSDGELQPVFITVSNQQADDYSLIIAGNEKVIRPRLADAAFFFETDKKTSLEARLEKLKHVVFQVNLGSVYDKTVRIQRLVTWLGQSLDLVVNDAERAATLCKSDLVSAMVYEFPEMQGLAGYHYALNDDESVTCARAIGEHYLPKFSGDALPQSNEGRLLAIADRIDTIVGIFGIGQKPTGSKDPFALRRASVSLLRLIVESKFDLDLRKMIAFASEAYDNLSNKNVVDDAFDYVVERFKAGYEEQSIPADVFQAVMACELSCPLEIDLKVRAVSDFHSLPEASSLAAANKRVANIIGKLEGAFKTTDIDQSLLVEPAEKNLAKQITAIQAEVKPLFDNRDYQLALSKLASLKEPVDTFFDDVMVMADNEALRNNRIGLLAKIRSLFLNVADISFLAPSKK